MARRKICLVPDCGKRAQHCCDGYCRKHWTAATKHGDPLHQREPIVCSVVGCDDQAIARCYCGKHYQRWRLYGDPLRERRSKYDAAPGVTPRVDAVRDQAALIYGVPHSGEFIGIYRIVNRVSRKCYVGQSVNVRKRVTYHFNRLRRGVHDNMRLQRAFKKYGEGAFYVEVVAHCEDAGDLDALENAFLSGNSRFDEPIAYNIQSNANAPSRGTKHSAESIKKFSEARKAYWARMPERKFSPQAAAGMRAARERRDLSNELYMERARKAADLRAEGKTFKEIGSAFGKGWEWARKLVLRYHHLKGIRDG